MNRFGFALVGAASLVLAGCGSKNDDSLNNAEAYNMSGNLDELANDAANDAEAEALGNQAQQLQQESNLATDDLNASGTSKDEENVAGM